MGTVLDEVTDAFLQLGAAAAREAVEHVAAEDPSGELVLRLQELERALTAGDTAAAGEAGSQAVWAASLDLSQNHLVLELVSWARTSALLVACWRAGEDTPGIPTAFAEVGAAMVLTDVEGLSERCRTALKLMTDGMPVERAVEAAELLGD